MVGNLNDHQRKDIVSFWDTSKAGAYMDEQVLQNPPGLLQRKFGENASLVAILIFMMGCIAAAYFFSSPALETAARSIGKYGDYLVGSIAVTLCIGSLALLLRSARRPMIWQDAPLGKDGQYLMDLKSHQVPDYVLKRIQKVDELFPKGHFTISVFGPDPIVWHSQDDEVGRGNPIIVYDNKGEVDYPRT